MAYRDLLLIGGPLELDDSEVPDDGSTIKVLKDRDSIEHLYYVIRDWPLNRWVGKYQRPVREVAK